MFGVVGNPIGHSVSPAMHNAAFDETRRGRRLSAARGGVGRGLPQVRGGARPRRASASPLPFKRALAEGAECDEDDAGSRLGVINTLKASARGWQARNTDVAGFLAPLDARAIALDGRRASVVGSGGAARAAAFALAARGARVTVHGRDRQSGRAGGGGRARRAATDAPASAGGWDLLVNATPVGTWPDVDATPVPAAALAGGGLVYDLVYNPAQTRLLSDAAAAGCAVIGGLEMLVAQAARQFEWWTGRPAPVDAMRAAAVRRLEEDAPADRTGDR